MHDAYDSVRIMEYQRFAVFYIVQQSNQNIGDTFQMKFIITNYGKSQRSGQRLPTRQ